MKPTPSPLLSMVRGALKGATALALAGSLFASAIANAEMVLRRGNGAEPGSLDPQISEGVPSSHVQRDLFEGLLAEAQDGALVPGMAESWEVSPDGLTYTFKLRDANWSNGDPVTAGDFVYAWTRAVNPATGSEYSFLLFPIKNAQAVADGKEKDLSKLGIKALDDKTLQVTLEGPAPYFLGMITHSIALPVHPGTVEKHGEKWTRPENIVSNGAFNLTAWVPQSHIELSKSDTYWDNATVKLDKVMYYPTEDQNAELKRYRAGELDWTYEVPNDQIKWIRDNLADEFHVANYLGTYYYGFNTTKPPFDNAKLRRALSMVIDREILTSKIVTAGETPAYSFVVPGVTGYDSIYVDFKDMDKKARVEEAKALYQEAGYSKDKPLEMEILYNTSENHKKIAIAISAMWKQALGVKVKLINQEWKVYLETRKQKKDTQVFRAGWIGDYNDPNTFLELWLSNAGLNDTSFKGANYDNLLQKATLEADPKSRMELLQTAEREFLESNAVAPIYHYVTKRMVKPNVKGYTINVMDHSRSKYMYLEQ